MQIFAGDHGTFSQFLRILSLVATIQMYYDDAAIQQFECSIVTEISNWG